MNKKVKLSLIIALVSLTVICGVFLIYVACGYKADGEAEALLSSENVTVEDGYITVHSQSDNDVGLIFYPGANVEYTAYLPLMMRLSDEGITCYLMKMPFNMAILDSNRADKVMESHGDEHAHWVIAGHSMGGVMASQYASEHQDKIEALILLGSYPYKEYPIEKTLTIYGSLNVTVEEKVNYTENVFVIDGGNHAYFGNYGEQAGDSIGEISREEQQSRTASIIADFLLTR